jgi:hypothetical protein
MITRTDPRKELGGSDIGNDLKQAAKGGVADRPCEPRARRGSSVDLAECVGQQRGIDEQQ